MIILCQILDNIIFLLNFLFLREKLPTLFWVPAFQLIPYLVYDASLWGADLPLQTIVHEKVKFQLFKKLTYNLIYAILRRDVFNKKSNLYTVYNPAYSQILKWFHFSHSEICSFFVTPTKNHIAEGSQLLDGKPNLEVRGDRIFRERFFCDPAYR